MLSPLRRFRIETEARLRYLPRVRTSVALRKSWRESKIIPNEPRNLTRSVNCLCAAACLAACAAGRFDVALCDFLLATANFPESLPVPTMLFQHNVESALWARHAEHERNAFKRPIYRLEAHRMAAYEAEAVRRFDHVIAVSEHDRTLMSQWVEPAGISVTPTGVDLARFRTGAPDP